MNLAVHDQTDCASADRIIAGEPSLAHARSVTLADDRNLFFCEFPMTSANLCVSHRGDMFPCLIANDVAHCLRRNPKDGSQIINGLASQISSSQLRDLGLIKFGSVNGRAKCSSNRPHRPWNHTMDASGKNSDDSGLAQPEMLVETSYGHFRIKIQFPDLFNIGRRHLCMSRQSSTKMPLKAYRSSPSANHVLRIFTSRSWSEVVGSDTSRSVARMQKNRLWGNRSDRHGIREPVSGAKQYCASIRRIKVKLEDTIASNASFSSSPQPAAIGLVNPLPECGGGPIINGREWM